MLKFGFINETREKVDKAFFKKYVDRLYKILKARIDKKILRRDGKIDLVLIGDKQIKALNKEYRGKDSPTDVISFAYLEVIEFKKVQGDVIVGDIFISVDTAKRQAKENGHDLKKEFGILFVHGLLHLFGFDHKNDKEEAEMERWALKVLKA
ncbi:MAG: rRNA maturation RNase YbeY [Patescibacteria group bacterium]